MTASRLEPAGGPWLLGSCPVRSQALVLGFWMGAMGGLARPPSGLAGGLTTA